MLLNFKSSGTGPPLIILHGLFGMLDNWQTVGKELEKDHTVYLVDQRNHGKSPHVPEHSYTLMADDLYEFCHQQNLSKISLLGHSMGGKTAMQFAIRYPKMISKLIIVDMGIKRYDGGHDRIFETLQQIDPKTISSRSQAEAKLTPMLPDPGVRQFLLKNLTRSPEGNYSWKFNLEALFNNYESQILAGIETNQPCYVQTLFIRGGKSDYIVNNDWKNIHSVFPNSQLVTIEGAGHWVHADAPVALIKAVRLFL